MIIDFKDAVEGEFYTIDETIPLDEAGSKPPQL